MTAFSEVEKGIPKAPGHSMLIEPGMFADTWENKPAKPVCVGLRTLSDGEKSTVRSEAAKLARELHEAEDANITDAFNDALMRGMIALGLCDPNDSTQPTEFLPMPEENIVRVIFTSSGVRRIFDEILKVEVETSPLCPEADDADLSELAGRLEADGMSRLDAASQSTARRHLLFALEALREADDEAA